MVDAAGLDAEISCEKSSSQSEVSGTSTTSEISENTITDDSGSDSIYDESISSSEEGNAIMDEDINTKIVTGAAEGIYDNGSAPRRTAAADEVVEAGAAD